MKDKKIVVFSCADEDYGLFVEQVISIEKIDTIKEVPKLPAYVKGLISIRGELVPVIDLSKCLFDREMEQAGQLIIVNRDRFTLALLVQEVKELLEVSQEQLHEPDILAYQKPAYFSGVVAINDRLILLMDVELLAETIDIEAIENYLAEEVDAEIS